MILIIYLISITFKIILKFLYLSFFLRISLDIEDKFTIFIYLILVKVTRHVVSEGSQTVQLKNSLINGQKSDSPAIMLEFEIRYPKRVGGLRFVE